MTAAVLFGGPQDGAVVTVEPTEVVGRWAVPTHVCVAEDLGPAASTEVFDQDHVPRTGRYELAVRAWSLGRAPVRDKVGRLVYRWAGWA